MVTRPVRRNGNHAVPHNPEVNPAFRVMAVPGIPIWSRAVRDDSLHPVLKPLASRITEYDKMANDGVIATLLTFMQLALLSGAVDVAGPNEAANRFLWANIRNLHTPISNVLAEALDLIRHGFSLQEMVFEQVPGGVLLADLYPLPPETLSGTQPWDIDQCGDLRSVIQRDPVTGESAMVPGAKLLHYTLGARRRSPEGRSMLADLWTTWRMKVGLLELLAICIERTSIGIPVLYPPNEITDPDKRLEYLAVLTGIRTDENAGVLMPGQKQGTSGDVAGWLLDTLEVSGDPVAIQQSIDYLDNVILGRGFASMLKLGTGDVGSFALHKSAAGLALMMLEYVQSVILEEMNGKLVPLIFMLNPQWRRLPRAEWPALLWNSPSKESLENLISLYGADLVTMTAQDRDFIRASAGVPEVNEVKLEEQARAEEAAQAEAEARAAEAAARAEAVLEPAAPIPALEPEPGSAVAVRRRRIAER